MLRHGMLVMWITILLVVDLSIVDAVNDGKRLFPVLFNLATRAKISSNATCGDNGPEQFCRLVEHVQRRPYDMQLNDRLHCDVCDSYSRSPNDAHPVTNAVDGSNSWWQSPTITRGQMYNWVTITLDLQQTYQVAYVIVKAANTPRPGNWILERSLDGVNYKPWQYYAVGDSECLRLYGVPPTRGIPHYKRDDDVICTSRYSKLNPLENGEIHTSIVNGRPGIDGPSETLLEFTQARYVRLRLQKIRTLNADLMTFIYSNPKDLDPSVTNRYFYSIKDISIGGLCFCLGRARGCEADQVTGELRCVCEDHTCGVNCNECCPRFNQLPWQPASYTDGPICGECECYNHSMSCQYNQTVADYQLSINTLREYEGGGVCQQCQHHTMGINCELCADGYYRPRGIDQRRTDSCHMCLCDVPGSIGLCIKDDLLEYAAIYAGDCLCREGYCGPRCGECSPGYKGFPQCLPCTCDRAGSVNVDICDDTCVCKPRVCGTRCDICLQGFYNLQSLNYNGCDPCFCFGIAQQCHSSIWGRMKLQDMLSWTVTDLVGSGYMIPARIQGGHVHMVVADARHLNRALYWAAPEVFLGNKVTAYGGILDFKFSFSIDANISKPNSYMANHDIILEGNGVRIGIPGRYYDEDTQHIIIINMTEAGWCHLVNSTSPKGFPVSRNEFMLLLGRISRLLIRASFHIYQTEAILYWMNMDVASEWGEGVVMAGVEMCVCPPGYAGTSCESCAPGYRRMGDILYGGVCEPCHCHSHSYTCDSITGECLSCTHNTQGAFCEECAFGYYGSATDGTPHGCRPCACPLPVPSNNFAQGCVATPSSNQGEYLCIGCPDGYMGTFCEICEPGYYGDPMVSGSSCKRCNCNGNSHNGDTCNPITGQCYDCLGKTEGAFCERCKEGYYGSAVDNNCKVCDCYGPGSVGTSCDYRTGQCTCRGQFAGLQCHRCQDGYGKVNLGCISCDCDQWGSVTSTCDTDRGQCTCKPGVDGIKCDWCQPRHYGFSSSGCRRCLCHVMGASDLDCHPVTGQCQCKRNVRGQACDECMDNYWNIDSGDGCQHCLCNMTGSVMRQCDDYTGQCQCHPRVTGRTCDRCLPGYYSFSSHGCRVCDRCDTPGHICHPKTGRCVCPPYTEGRHCEKCTFDAWGYDPQRGCQPCSCRSEGSLDTHCDLHTGQCMCLDNYIGRQCNRCQSGHFGFPACQPCDCNKAGTVIEKCGDTRGQCECRGDGQCPCKANVYKRRCTSCNTATFSMRADNPSGCTPCFCFHRSSQCHQAPYVWSQVSLPDRSAVIHLSQNETLPLSEEGFLMIPPSVSIVTVNPAYRQKPLYWQLPSMLLGDMTLSYSGKLTFKVAWEIAGNLAALTARNGSQHPLVILIGNYNLQLSYEVVEPMTSGYVHEFSVALREDLWRDAEGRPATRDLLMVALQHVNKWLVKASNSVDIDVAHLLDVTLQEAVPANGAPPTAFGVEQCVCPHEYTGLSCQDPAAGYYRSRLRMVIDVTGNMDPMDLVSRIYPCQCYGQASTCNKDTGICQNCRNSTAGDNCEFCQRGYYGDPTNGYTCRPCACPRVDNNFSSSCHVTASGYFICDACDKGYSGVHCERCGHGYYGNPLTPGGHCVPCDCNPEGTRNDGACDPYTGACDCQPGVTGRHCDVCQPKYALFNGACISCYEGCPGILMTSLDDNEIAINSVSVSSTVLPPWKLLTKMEEHVSEYKELLRFLPSRRSVNSVPDSTRIRNRAATLIRKANGLQRRAPKLERSSANTHTKATALLKEVSRVTNSINGLPQLIGGIVSRRLDGGVWDISDALAKVKVVMDIIRNKNFSRESANADESLREARQQLEKLQLIILQHTLDPATVWSRLNQTLTRLTDLDQQLAATQKTLLTSKTKNSNNKQLLDEMRQSTELFRSRLYSVADKIQVAAQFNEDAAFLLWNVSSKNYKAQVELVAQLATEVRALKRRVATFEQDLPHVEPLVRDAEKHATQLNSQHGELDSLFSGTRKMAADPLRAATAYKDMAAAIFGAQDAANEASTAVENVSQKILEQSGHSELPVQATEAFRVSRELHDRATHLRTESSDLEPVLEQIQQLTKDTLENNILIDDKLWDLQHSLKNFTSDLRSRVRDLGSKSSATATRSADLLHDIRTMQAKADHVMRPKLRELTELSNDGTDDAVAAVRTAKVEVRRLTNITRVLDHQRARLERLGSDVGRNIAILKEQIWQAREQAKNIKVSMQSDGDCVHRYEADLEPSTTSVIRLFFKTSNVKENMLLFLLRNPYASDYLAVELVNSRVRFSWDVGAGGSLIEHDLPIQSSAGKLEEANKWYKVDAMRTANVGRLSVKRLSSSTLATEVSTSAVASHIKLDVDSTSHLFVGGVSQDYKVPGLVTSKKFIGCIGDVSLDGKRIGLYNFRQLEGTGCSSCTTVPTEDGVSGVYQFDGSGFAQLPQVRLHPERLSVTFKFKTFWEEALLFLTINEATRDVMSVQLEGGHVVFQYSFGGRPSIRLQTRRRYNSNKWVTVVASRLKLEGLLKVSKEMRRGEASEPFTDTMDLQQSSLYFGGSPTSLNVSSYNISTLSFLGCFKDIQIASRGTYFQDLMSSVYVGVQGGCYTKKARVVGFFGRGYLEVGSPDLSTKADSSFSFRTQQKDALLFLAQGVNTENYYSVSLTGGRLSAWFSSGSGNSRITSLKTYNDGRQHSVALVKNNHKIDMYVDDKLGGSTKLPAGANMHIGSMRGASGGLYIGGIPAGGDYTGVAASLTPLRGCLQDLVINGKILALDTPVNFSNVDVGRCAQQRIFHDLPVAPSIKEYPVTPAVPSFTVTVTLPPPITTTVSKEQPKSCATEGRYGRLSSGVAFGDVRHSHAEVAVKGQSVNKDFSMSVNFRTFYTYGLIFYMSTTARTEHIAVYLKGGRVHVSYNRNGDTRTMRDTKDLSDGNWHTVIVAEGHKRLSLKVDQRPAIEDHLIHGVNVIAPVYVGGLPPHYEIQSGIESESFKGCLMRFHLRGTPVDLTHSKTIMGVRKCFNKVERGAHFDGYSYAVYAEKFEVQTDFEVALEFRTAYRRGILLTASHPRGKPALALEINDGQLKFSAVNNGGRFTAVSAQCDYCLCDNKWHKVKAVFSKHIVTLKVDEDSVKLGISPSDEVFLGLRTALYIGGFPAFALPQGATHASDYFTGCLRNIHINGIPVDWHAMHSLVDVHVGACPVSSPPGGVR